MIIFEWQVVATRCFLNPSYLRKLPVSIIPDSNIRAWFGPNKWYNGFSFKSTGLTTAAVRYINNSSNNNNYLPTLILKNDDSNFFVVPANSVFKAKKPKYKCQKMIIPKKYKSSPKGVLFKIESNQNCTKAVLFGLIVSGLWTSLTRHGGLGLCQL